MTSLGVNVQVLKSRLNVEDVDDRKKSRNRGAEAPYMLQNPRVVLNYCTRHDSQSDTVAGILVLRIALVPVSHSCCLLRIARQGC